MPSQGLNSELSEISESQSMKLFFPPKQADGEASYNPCPGTAQTSPHSQSITNPHHTHNAVYGAIASLHALKAEQGPHSPLQPTEKALQQKFPPLCNHRSLRIETEAGHDSSHSLTGENAPGGAAVPLSLLATSYRVSHHLWQATLDSQPSVQPAHGTTAPC